MPLAPTAKVVVGLMTEITEEQAKLYHQGGLVLNIECSVFFADAHGKHRQQIFGRVLCCSPTGQIVKCAGLTE